MERMIKYHSINQYRDVVRNVKHKAQFVGLDSDGNAIMDLSAKMPTLKFIGTIKSNGSNFSVCIDPNLDFWCQSRENIITPEKDNAGSAAFGYYNKEIFLNISTTITELYDVENTYNKTILICGEWCGGNIQKGVAITGLPKMFIIFNIALVDREGQKIWLTREEMTEVLESQSIPYLNDNHIYSVYQFQTFEIDIDFNKPEIAQNELNALCEMVEKQCPIGLSFGVDGIGEGLVFKPATEGFEDSGYWMKVKGEAHSKSKVKTLAAVDVERISNILDLVDKLANNGRLEQFHQIVFDTLNGGTTDMSKMGEFIKAVSTDCLKEELDTIQESGFTMKELGSFISKNCREFISNKMNEEAGI